MKTLSLNPTSLTRRQAILMLMLTAFLWSSSGLFVKMATWPPLPLWGARSIIATIVFWMWLRPTSLRFNRLELLTALAYMFTQLFFFFGTKLAPAANVIFLANTSLVWVILLSTWLLGERLSLQDIVASLVVIVGMVLIFVDGVSFSGLEGNIFGLLSGMCLATMMICMRKQKDANPGNSILLGNILGALVGIPFILQETLTPEVASIIVYMGIFQIGIATILYSIAITRLPVVESSLIVTLEPILNPIWVFLVLGEVPGNWAMLGCAVVLAGIMGRTLAASSEPVETAIHDTTIV